jgi:hypothetical protein
VLVTRMQSEHGLGVRARSPAAGTWLPLVVLVLAVIVSRVSGRRYLKATMRAADERAATVG